MDKYYANRYNFYFSKYDGYWLFDDKYVNNGQISIELKLHTVIRSTTKIIKLLLKNRANGVFVLNYRFNNDCAVLGIHKPIATAML